MGSRYGSTTTEILGELHPGYFEPYKNSIEVALQALSSDIDFEKQVELCGECLREFWAHYARDHIANVLEVFPRVQRALFGLEEGLEGGSRYRDHYVHMFDVYITGARILSQIIGSLPESDKDNLIRQLFRITPEPDSLPFPKPYTATQRAFFLWTLIATFHDVGIPVEHLDKVREGLNRFLGYFGFRLTEFNLAEQTHVTAQLPYYFSLMSRLYKEGIHPNRDQLYTQHPIGSPYLSHALTHAFGAHNHGVMSGICLLNSYEETFLVGRHEVPGYDLDLGAYSVFASQVLEHDIARAALAISLHSLSVDRFPKLFPIDPKRFPLTYLLILCDEIQEPFRHEGISYRGITKLKSFPEINVCFQPAPLQITVDVANYYTALEPSEERKIIDAYNQWAGRYDSPAVSDYRTLLSVTWERIAEVLSKKLLFDGVPFSLSLRVHMIGRDGSLSQFYGRSLPPSS